MNWFNDYGLIFMAIIMIPNIIFAIKNKNARKNAYQNKTAQILEQISRYACIVLMMFNIPYTWMGFYFSFAEIVYIVVDSIFVLAYCVVWIVLWKKSGIVKALLLSIIPSLIFLFSGIMIASIPLTVFAVIFAVTHILISVKNAVCTETSNRIKSKSIITALSVMLSFILIVVLLWRAISIRAKQFCKT